MSVRIYVLPPECMVMRSLNLPIDWRLNSELRCRLVSWRSRLEYVIKPHDGELHAQCSVVAVDCGELHSSFNVTLHTIYIVSSLSLVFSIFNWELFHSTPMIGEDAGESQPYSFKQLIRSHFRVIFQAAV